MTRRKEEAERTRETILDAAEATFLEQGVSRTTLAHIAAAAGVTRGAIYWHFEDKEALFDALLERVRIPIDEIVDHADDGTQASPMESVRAIAQSALTRICDDRQLQRVATIVFHRCETHEDRHPRIGTITRLSRHAQDRVEAIFEQARDQGQLRADLSPTAACRQLHLFLLGACFDWLQDTTQYSLADECDSMVETLMRGLAA
ncbi:MAG: TetR family transcriptional regulator [Pseudomonadota bacterium]